MECELVWVRADGQMKAVALKPGSTVVGRQEGCGLRVSSATMSRRHCEITVGEGSVRIKDLGSSNGTFVNQERVQTADLEPGDLISVGGLVFVLRVNNEPETVEPMLSYEDGLPEAELPKEKKAAKPAAAPKPAKPGAARGGLLEDLGAMPKDPESSSVVEFDFDFDDDEDQQPPL